MKPRLASSRLAAATGGLTLVGLLLRLPGLSDALFGDELSTYYVVTGRSFGGMLHLLHGTAIELNPPLFFAFAWLGEHVAGNSVQSLRWISLAAGVSAIPLTYVLGRLTVGARAAVLAAALVTLSPFLIYFSSEARTYSLLMGTLLLSSVALLMALRTGGRRWWALYAVASAAAMYTHYTSVFVLIGQFVWAFATHPRARLALMVATVGAGVAFAPWLPSLSNTTHSPGRNIIAALEPFGPHIIALALGRWSMGHPFLSLADVPGRIWVAAIGAGVVLALVRLGAERRHPRRLVPETVFPVVLAISTPIGLALYSLVGRSVWDSRSLISSWPGLAVAASALLVGSWSRSAAVQRSDAPGGRWRAARASIPAALVLLGFGVGAAKMLQVRHHRPDYLAAAGYVAAHSATSDPVVDFGALTPGPPNETEAAFALAPGSPARRHPLLRLAQPPLARILAAPAYAPVPIQPGAAVAQEAVRAATHGRLFLIMAGYAPIATIQAVRRAPGEHAGQTAFDLLAAFLRALPPSYVPVREHSFNGLFPVTVFEFDLR